MPNLVVIAGAPSHSSLSRDDLLLDTFDASIAHFARLPCPSPEPTKTSSGTSPVWRSIPLARSHLATGFSQPLAAEDSFLHPDHLLEPETSFTSASSSILDSFYDDSLSFYGPHNPSRLSSDPSGQQPGSPAPSLDPPLGANGHLSDLEDIPPAPALLALRPQTVVVNLIVGIISLSEPRAVRTRWGAERTLLEVVVGDETKSGFTVTFWLPHDVKGTNPPRTGSLAKELSELRRRDVVLMRNIVLSVFRDKVYGQSARGHGTRVDLLYRKKVDRIDKAGWYKEMDLASRGALHPQLEKTRKVRGWVLAFVGGEAAKLKPGRSWDIPPDDTQ